MNNFSWQQGQLIKIRWGTETPILLNSPEYNVPVPVRAFGEIEVKVVDAKVMEEMIRRHLDEPTHDELVNFFRGICVQQVREYFHPALIDKNIPIPDIFAHREGISQALKERISPAFDELGVELVDFRVEGTAVPMEFSNEKMYLDNGLPQARGLGPISPFDDHFNNLINQVSQLERIPARICPYCNNTFPDTYKFCPYCGKRQAGQCTSCGALLEGHEDICRVCGMPRED